MDVRYCHQGFGLLQIGELGYQCQHQSIRHVAMRLAVNKDFIPADRKELPLPQKPEKKAFHVKILCSYCGNLLGHFKVETNQSFFSLEVEPCQECLVDMAINQQIVRVKEHG